MDAGWAFPGRLALTWLRNGRQAHFPLTGLPVIGQPAKAAPRPPTRPSTRDKQTVVLFMHLPTGTRSQLMKPCTFDHFRKTRRSNALARPEGRVVKPVACLIARIGLQSYRLDDLLQGDKGMLNLERRRHRASKRRLVAIEFQCDVMTSRHDATCCYQKGQKCRC
jgi:hypothetical protein